MLNCVENTSFSSYYVTLQNIITRQENFFWNSNRGSDLFSIIRIDFFSSPLHFYRQKFKRNHPINFNSNTNSAMFFIRNWLTRGIRPVAYLWWVTWYICVSRCGKCYTCKRFCNLTSFIGLRYRKCYICKWPLIDDFL